MSGLRKLLCLGTGVLALAGAAKAQVVISQVYGGGGNSGATYRNDFIELFNRGSTPVSIAGWSVQYASAAGTSWQVTNIGTGSVTTLNPGQYYLIQESAGTGGTTDLPTPDATGTGNGIALSATAGKVALVSGTTALTGSNPTSGVLDLVGFGTTASGFEGSGPTAAPTNTTAVLRVSNGCTDTNNNAADFVTGAPTPRNSASATNICGGSTPVPPAGSGMASPASACPSVAVTLTVTVAPGVPANPIASVVGDGTSIGAGVINFSNTTGNTWVAPNITIDPSVASGAKSIPVTITESADSGGRTGSTTVGLTVSNCTFGVATTGTGVSPAVTCEGSPITFTVAVRKNQIDPPGLSTGVAVTLNLSSVNGPSSVAMTDLGDEAANPNFRDFSYTYLTPTGLDVGEYTVFVNATDDQGHSAASMLLPTLQDCVSSSSDVVISQFYGGGGATTGTPSFKVDYVELFNRGSAPVAIDGWTIQYGSATGTGSWNVSSALSGTIPVGGYYLVSMTQSANSIGADLPIAADATPTTALSMSATDGKVALVNGNTALTGASPTDPSIKDLLGYGSANGHEGDAAAPVLTNQLALFRQSAGCQDYDQNGADFFTGAPAPRNSATAPNFCNGAPTGSCCTAAGDCSITTQAACSDTWASGGSCMPNVCPLPSSGVCCRGATCNTSFTSADACTGSLTPGRAAGAVFLSTGSCNASGNSVQPCCYGDYNKANGITVQDIFSFLADWFAGSPYAKVGGDGAAGALTVQNIFDFLAAWFAGGC